MSLFPNELEEESFEYNCPPESECKDSNDLEDAIDEEDQGSLEEVLCAERVGQMTKTYNDIDAVTRLLEEYAVENEELSQHLGAAKDAQRQLTSEDSLAAEIEGTMRKELQLDDPIAEEQKIHHKRVFETVKNINQTVKQRSLAPSPMNIPGSNQSSSLNSALSSCMSTPRSSFYGGDISNIVIDNRTNSIILETESPDGSEDTNKKPGTPGTPGSHDLETALRRLSLRRENYLSERRFFVEDRERKLRDLAEKGELYSGSLTPTDSIMSLSTNHSGLSGLSFISRSYLPEKLQIVKPLEGSATLHHWQQLAQPNLGGILDPRPGVVTKGFRPLELDLEEVYQLADFEEDESGDVFFQELPTSTPAQHMETSGERSRGEQVTVTESGTFPNQAQLDVVETQEQKAADDEVSVYHPGKCMSHTSSTYTFTTCRILHPSDELTRVTPSFSMGPTTTCVSMNSLKSTPVATPCTPRRLSLAESFTNQRDSTKTMSTSLGLVRMLQERGISAAVYNPRSWDRADSPLLTPCAPRADVLPSTPPNSPTGPPFEFKGSSPLYDNFLASKPASSILKEVRGESKSSCNSECQTDVSVYNLNLVDKLKRFGIAKVVSPEGTPQPPPVTGMPRPFLSGAHRSVPTFRPGGLGREGLPLGSPVVVTSAIGGLQLNAGIRRNQNGTAVFCQSLSMGPTTTCISMNNLKCTPVATPSTPRRLSLAESFTNLRDSTKTMSTSLGLVRLLQERGISAAVYNPWSWDRADSPLLTPCAPRADVLPSTPPNSPTTQHQMGPPFEFRGSSPPYDNFLASKPASSILKEVRGESKSSCNSECQTDVSVYNLNLVDKLKRFGIAKVVSPGGTPQPPPVTGMPRSFLSGAHRSVPTFRPGGLGREGLPLGSPVVVTSAIGGLQLNAGIRRNQSFPAMVGASMQMKGPMPQSSGILMGPKLPKQTSLR
ncbi:UNVERIFIED_CONTAM: hypothetical protein FKN15_056341 [Acipenser sinensis]